LGKASALAGDEYKKEMKCMMLDDEVKEKKKNSHYRNAGHLGRR
jgi:hypothetical protein